MMYHRVQLYTMLYNVNTLHKIWEHVRHVRVISRRVTTTLYNFGADVCHTDVAVSVKVQSLGGRALFVRLIRVQVSPRC